MESNAARSIRPAWVPPPSIPIAYVSQACMAPSHHGFASDYYIAAAHRHRYWRQLQLVVHPPLLITRDEFRRGCTPTLLLARVDAKMRTDAVQRQDVRLRTTPAHIDAMRTLIRTTCVHLCIDTMIVRTHAYVYTYVQ
uniref:Uncharacterized protein n=1 Tax=Oryza sativa subsp. japonica TaxID=39947 RepID=Q67VJ7_ORYSJ|nr:hypothetical protein [Oryza sativa Japonica Group]BAD37822.1 hypothetical protein [Oryza sativa Japonica Group]